MDLATHRVFTQTCSITRLEGRGGTGPAYGAQTRHRCRVRQDDYLDRFAGGDDRDVYTRVLLHKTVQVGLEDRVQLPDGRDLRVIRVRRAQSPAGGDAYVEVTVG